MKAIWKYPIDGMHSEIAMPKGAEILTAQVQGRNVCIWALCDMAYQSHETRVFSLVPTGAEVEIDIGRYVSTVQMGAFVFHVFEVTTTL